MGANKLETKKLWFHYIRLALVTLTWGGAFVAGRFTVGEIGPFTVAFWRFAIASAVLWGFLQGTGQSVKIKRNEWWLLIPLGLTGIFIYNALFFMGLKYTTAINGSLIIATNPVVTTIIAALILRETVGWRQVLGILVSFSGVAMVVTGGSLDVFSNLGINKGDLIISGAPIAWAFYSVLGKKAMVVFSPLVATTYACLIGALMLLPFAIWEGTNWTVISAANWGAIAYMSIFASVIAFNWWYSGINALGAGRASIFINLVPLWTMLLAATILNENIILPQLLGALLIMSGVYLTSKKTVKLGSVPTKAVDSGKV